MFKEKIVHLHELPILECDFSWDTDKLQANIRAYKPDYDPKDPWTWPQLRSTQHPGYDENKHNAVTLPQGIAYPRAISHQFVRPNRTVKLKHSQVCFKSVSWMVDANILFPFSYDGYGLPRAEDELAACDRWNWIYKMTGTHLTILEGEAEPEPERPESTTGAFNEVIRMVNETSGRDAAEVEMLRKEVSQLKALHIDQAARADEAKREVASATKAHQEKIARICFDAKSTIKDYKTQISELTTHIRNNEQDLGHTRLQLVQQTQKSEYYQVRLSAAEAEVKTLRQSLKERDQKAQGLENEAATAREQVMKIWAEMKKVKDAEGRKRKGSEDVSDFPMKKVRHI